MTDLDRFLEEMAATPQAFGYWDCAMTLANWVRVRTGRDPATVLRGSYASDREWRRIVAEAGGLVALVDGLAATAGLSRVSDALAGDIAVVATAAHAEVGGIRVSEAWAMKVGDGIVVAPATPVAIWRVP